ncbi:hypothetical protein MJO29_015232 [Puccinia striiformis f. sp. tritici]|uniref:SET domain-containing protein n=4 Tax=Puccinia striiformis TaxID=27350 RepID=A0A0L0W255_9BASI|nr:hypothetical protein Pst134EA_028817 [Puccinia striiformis f. sp. tritici]KAI9623475.1 hypothetical protein H4Q26_014648 [Puccinia striiformis f. sp. tritici PST-130]KNF05547.1 hypothetical protein PSTG_01358 [Puccinia striiformis f. sp. tritici PST-78]POV97934.1 hypothetical protein PSHT_14306 [Puccinia striiformis]KAH9440879.1 hypothetical protein Pst134EB_029532 [Puccinia striiformis f. sp. tritici]KAH9446828.1 hypothetical protein Pst134EA_028817 [Puccinia striiformis f. sp. tritici]
MLATTFLVSFGIVAPSLGISDLSFSSLLLSPLSHNPFGPSTSANVSSINSCPGAIHHSQPSVNSSASDSLVYKYDKVAPAGPGVPFGHGFFQHSCHPDPEIEEDESFCIFLNPSINQGSGMVVVAKPTTFNESLESQLHLSTHPEKNDAFNVVEMPHKGGMGAIASRRLESGELVINSRATLLVSVEEATYDRPDWFHIRKLAADLLPLETRGGLARLFGTGDSEEDWISSAIDMNSFEISLGKDSDVPFFAVFLTPSRLNHDCRPNTAFHVDSESLEIHMHALRVISPGEEMTISYRDMTQTREKRQADIAHYGFQCTCAHCRMNDAQASESDRRLTRLEELSNKLVDWNEAANQVMLDEAEELLELYLLERLDNNIADGYTVAAVTYNSFGLTTRARRYATKALATGLTNFGANWEEFEPLRQLAESPEEHWSHQARMFE